MKNCINDIIEKVKIGFKLNPTLTILTAVMTVLFVLSLFNVI